MDKMNEQQLVDDKEEIERRFRESGLADACVEIAKRLGKNRGSKLRDYYTNINYVYKGDGFEIDCDIGQNMQGDGELTVKQGEKIVLELSGSSHDRLKRQELPTVKASYVDYKLTAYISGDWEKKILKLRDGLKK